ncbi:hypothetical protein G7K_1225-t1 [Saitoella complicata NRRL Y-17804]|uniref:Uncharacterized protein n=1 Tax=Saitoella complicata (strain BCRC 22490 / CBS 7301 / JCM 7358 / NBRC 10748 / NRRL Y-17804) TaxID=698492 RepID=A0A0E9NBD9_SAICN|nr:hypothetical protein G7K_1225-t1 [Saitoella complicata NRRL Y-17804]
MIICDSVSLLTRCRCRIAHPSRPSFSDSSCGTRRLSHIGSSQPSMSISPPTRFSFHHPQNRYNTNNTPKIIPTIDITLLLDAFFITCPNFPLVALICVPMFSKTSVYIPSPSISPHFPKKKGFGRTV